MITITIPCTCDDEEHEVYFERDGSGGISEGDVMPCGYVTSPADVEIAMRRLAEYGDTDGL